MPRDAAAESMPEEPALPLADPGAAAGRPRATAGRLLRPAPVVAALVAGAAIGLAIRSEPVADLGAAFRTAPEAEVGTGAEAPGAPVAARGSVFALGRLVPQDDLVTLAPPYGAGDARIAALHVAEGDRVAAGDTVAELDNLPQLEAALDAARSNEAVAAAALAQTRVEVSAGLREAEAARDRAAAALALAVRERDRARGLHARGVATDAALDRAEAAVDDATAERDRAAAALLRYAGFAEGQQADIQLAERRLAAAEAERARAERDLARGRVVAPVAGTILAVRARIGERPGPEGVAALGDVGRMAVDLEVYHTDIGRVALGQGVEVRAEALGDAILAGTVTRVGLAVGKQSLVADDPAANTDARVVEVRAALDRASSERAAALTGLEVVGRIDAGTP